MATMTPQPSSPEPAKKQRPRKQVRLKKRKLAEASASTESEDEDVKAAKEHQEQKPRPVEKPEPQEKPSKKRKANDAASQPNGGEKKPRLPKNKRAKSKAQEKHSESVKTVEEAAPVEKKEARFIVFIGNLPFTTTKSAVEKHFAAVQPSSVRIITHRDDPRKGKGFAFLEFEGYDRMQSCLLKFHHTMFNDGTCERKINVELTAGGGGGKSQARKAKLETKNQKLDEQRKRKTEEEEKLKMEKKAKRPQAESGVESGIHPSRRRQVR